MYLINHYRLYALTILRYKSQEFSTQPVYIIFPWIISTSLWNNQNFFSENITLREQWKNNGKLLKNLYTKDPYQNQIMDYNQVLS